MILCVVVHAASLQDRDGAKLVLAKLAGSFGRLKLIWADGGYAGQLIEWARHLGRWTLEIVKRCDDASGFKVLPKRWIVERTIAWLNRCRRLAKDWECLNRSALAFLRWASVRMMLRRLCQDAV